MKTVKVKFTISTNGESSNVSEILEVVVDNQFTESEMIQAINERYKRWVSTMNIGGWSFMNEKDSNNVEFNLIN